MARQRRLPCRPESAAAGQRTIYPGQQQRTARLGVLPWQVSQLVVETLEAQIHRQGGGVFAEDHPRGLQGLGHLPQDAEPPFYITKSRSLLP